MAVLVIVAVLTPPAEYDDDGVQVTLLVSVTVPEVLALPIVVPLLVAVSTPVEEFTAVNPLTTDSKE